MNRAIGNKLGFTLVEVLIAIAILGVFVFPISGMFVSSLRASETARVSAEAYAIANRVIESMGSDEMSTPMKDEFLSADDYTSYKINNAFEVKKTIDIVENEKLDSIADLESLNRAGTLLTIDTRQDGLLVFTNSLLSQLGYSLSFAPNKTTITIDFDDVSVKAGGSVIANKNFDHIRMIGGNSNLKLILNNNSETNKTLYTVDMVSDGSFSIETVATTKAQWYTYDNFSATEQNAPGNVAASNKAVTVRHIATNRAYTVSTKRVFYKYELLN